MRNLTAIFAAAIVLVACSGGVNQLQSQNAGVVPPASNASIAAAPRVLAVGRPHLFRPPHWYRTHRRPSVASNLLYNGGAVQTTPAIYLVFWGIASPSDTVHDPDGVATYLTNFASSIPASSWLNTVTQYYRSGPTYIGNPGTEYGGAYYDATLPPSTTYTSAQIAAEAAKGMAHFGYSANANYIVVSAHGYTISGFGTSFCGYHTGASTGSGTISYTVLPYTPDVGGSCGAGFVTSPGTLDGVSIVGGHEIAETQTDPLLNAWYDASGQEIGDKCAWTNLQNTRFSNGKSFPTQPLWSNASSSCVQSYTSSATPTPPPPTPTPAPGAHNVIVNGAFASGMSPWVTCPGSVGRPILSGVFPLTGRVDAMTGNFSTQPEPKGAVAICQLVTINAGAVLTAYTRGVSNDSNTLVTQFGALYTASGQLDYRLYSTDENDSAWQKRTFALPASLAGHRDYVAFGVVGNGDAGKYIEQFIDDISLVE